MKQTLFAIASLCAVAVGVTACGGTDRTYVERPIVMQQPSPVNIVPQRQFIVPDSSAQSIETICPSGYSNITHSCY